MKIYQDIIIGFGKGGKTLAAELAFSGREVALVEKSPQMYGGTCINVACIPTKSLEHSARLSQVQGGDFQAQSERYRAAIEEKRRLTAMLRQKNYDKLISAGVTVHTGIASFTGPHNIRVDYPDGTSGELYGEHIIINTGARPFIPPITGLTESRFSYTSESLMELDVLPARLVIIGAGYIGLEFSSYFTNFGSSVTVIQDGGYFIPREDREIANTVFDSLKGRGITFMENTQVLSVRDEESHAVLTLKTAGGPREIEADAVLIATGRRPNVESLSLEAAGVEVTERGAIRVDESLRTCVPHIWAMGDVAGGLQFTYISLDDFRIVKGQLLGNNERTSANRGSVPYSVFIDPPLSRIGLTEDEAVKSGHNIRIGRLSAAAIPKAHILQRPSGMLKVIIDTETSEILGAHFFCAESQEMINLIKLAMDAHLPYTALKDSIYTHPTMCEALNDLFQGLDRQ